VIAPVVDVALIALSIVALTTPPSTLMDVDPLTLLAEIPKLVAVRAPEFAIVMEASVEFANIPMFELTAALFEILIGPVSEKFSTLEYPAKIPILFAFVVAITPEFVMDVGLFRVTARMPTSPAEIAPLLTIVLLPAVGSVSKVVVTIPNRVAFTLPEFVTDIAPLGEMSSNPL